MNRFKVLCFAAGGYIIYSMKAMESPQVPFWLFYTIILLFLGNSLTSVVFGVSGQ